MHRTCVAALLATLLASDGRAQEPGMTGQPDVRRGIPAQELELRFFEPRNVDADQLYEYARSTLARTLEVSDDGGKVVPVATVGLVGRRIVLYDEPAQVERVLQRLHALDAPAEESEPSHVTREFAPRFVSLSAALEALSPFQSRGSRRTVFPVEGRNVLVLRGPEDEVAAMEEVLRRVDAPEPQVTLTCYVVRRSDAADPALPRELAENLRVVLPGMEFALAGVGVLRTSAAPQREVELGIDTDLRARYRLALRIAAFDPTSGALTADRCSLVRSSTAVAPGTAPVGDFERIFETSAVFRGGEYTVLAATGADPVFLVVRVTPAG